MALKRWIGAADAVAQISTITFSTYASAQTYTVTINGKDISFTSVTGTNSEIWAGLQAAWENSSIPEIVEAVATVASGLVLTSRTPGQPFTVGASATTGTATVTPTQAATGPNFFNNADNWEGGVAPVATDDILFSESNVDCLYALDPGFALASVTIDQSYTGKIGLARLSSSGYQEYRLRYLTLSATSVITIGAGSGQGSNRILIDADSNAVTLNVYSSGQDEGNERAVQVINPAAGSVLAVYGGRVALGGSGGGTGLSVIGREGATPPSVTVAEGLSVGVVLVSGNNTSLELYGTAASIDASTSAQVHVMDDAVCPIVKTASGASVFWNSTADITTKLYVYPQGIASFARRNVARTVVACELHAGGTLMDPFGTIAWPNGITLVGLVRDVALDIGRNETLLVGNVGLGEEVLDSENADRNLTSAVTVLTHTPDASNLRRVYAVIFLGDGTKNLTGAGGTFTVGISVGGDLLYGAPQSYTLGADARAVITTPVFAVPANQQVIVQVTSPNADSDVDVTAYLISEGA